MGTMIDPAWQAAYDAGIAARKEEIARDHDPDEVLFALLKKRNGQFVNGFWAGWRAEFDREEAASVRQEG